MHIAALTSDYLNVTEHVYTWKEKYESPAVLKNGNTYFMFASQLTGWNPNDNYYSTASSLRGPWSGWKKFAPSGSNTHTSQTTHVFPLSSSTALYLGDRWVPDNLMSSTYIWLPLQISGTTATLPWYYNWILDPKSSIPFKAAPADNTYEAESGTLSGGAKTVSCSGCSGGKAVGYIGGSSNGAVTFRGVQSNADTRTTIRMRYTNGDKTERFAEVVVNGGERVRAAFVPSANGQETGVASITVGLRRGENTIEVRGVDGGYGPDVDRILVPVE